MLVRHNSVFVAYILPGGTAWKNSAQGRYDDHGGEYPAGQDEVEVPMTRDHRFGMQIISCQGRTTWKHGDARDIDLTGGLYPAPQDSVEDGVA